MSKENILLTNKHILICIQEQIEKITQNEFLYDNNELKYITENFCGRVMSDILNFSNLVPDPDTDIYICGDIHSNMDTIERLENFTQINKIYIIQEFSFNYENYIDIPNIKVIKSGLVPINIYNTGVFFRNCLGSPDHHKNFISDSKYQSIDYFNSIVNEHKFQSLTESNKETNAFRSGIYITKVEPDSTNQENLNWHLLRCSSNLSGPSDNTNETDNEIITQTNQLASKFFESNVSMNHVLAQIYTNSSLMRVDGECIQKKAKIKTHSDKTKDMPIDGIMGFCSFYKGYNGENFIDEYKKSQTDIFDYVYGNSNTSVLTKLRFRLKKDVPNYNNQYNQQFDIILYPNSVFIMSLMTNRIYTHEIVPSTLPIDKIPTRMGYVIRCSDTIAKYKDGNTYINKGNKLIELEEPDYEGIQKLKNLYYKENMTSEKIVYEEFNFSLNKGDYTKPTI
jgi:hypothetical protein